MRYAHFYDAIQGEVRQTLERLKCRDLKRKKGNANSVVKGLSQLGNFISIAHRPAEQEHIVKGTLGYLPRRPRFFDGLLRKWACSMSNKRWRCVWIKNNTIWGTKNVCYYCGQRADSIDHIIPKAILRQLAALGDEYITHQVLRRRALKVWACRECNSLASCSLQDSLDERRDYVKNKLRNKYKKLLMLPDWTDSEKEELEIGRAHV